MTRDDIFAAITAERARQAKLRDEGRFAFTLDMLDVEDVRRYDHIGSYPITLATPVTNLMRYPILAEEVGEVARAMNDGDDENMKEELVQVAALAVAWLEAL